MIYWSKKGTWGWSVFGEVKDLGSIHMGPSRPRSRRKMTNIEAPNKCRASVAGPEDEKPQQWERVRIRPRHHVRKQAAHVLGSCSFYQVCVGFYSECKFPVSCVILFWLVCSKIALKRGFSCEVQGFIKRTSGALLVRSEIYNYTSF